MKKSMKSVWNPDGTIIGKVMMMVTMMMMAVERMVVIMMGWR